MIQIKKLQAQFILLFTLLCLSISAYSQSYNFQQVGSAKDWNEARDKCQKLGRGWDLPTAQQTEMVLRREMAIPLEYYEVGTSQKFSDFVMWVRSEREEYNIQLIDKAVALRYSPYTEEVFEFDLSPESFQEMELTLSQVKRIPSNQIRTAEEQGRLTDAIKAFEARHPFAGIYFETNMPYPHTHPLLASLPSDIFTAEIKFIMLKFNPEYLNVLEKNITIILHDFSAGLEVVCMTDRAQPNLGSIFP